MYIEVRYLNLPEFEYPVWINSSDISKNPTQPGFTGVHIEQFEQLNKIRT